MIEVDENELCIVIRAEYNYDDAIKEAIDDALDDVEYNFNDGVYDDNEELKEAANRFLHYDFNRREDKIEILNYIKDEVEQDYELFGSGDAVFDDEDLAKKCVDKWIVDNFDNFF